jgi:hypothetical protein
LEEKRFTIIKKREKKTMKLKEKLQKKKKDNSQHEFCSGKERKS